MKNILPTRGRVQISLTLLSFLFCACSYSGKLSNNQRRIPQLVQDLSSNNRTARLLALSALADIGPEAKAAAPSLLKALGDGDERVRRKAAFAISRLKPADHEYRLTLINALREKNSEDAQTLAEMGAPAVPSLLDALGDKDAGSKAAYALSQVGKQTVPALMHCLIAEDPRTRQYAAQALGALGADAKDAIPLLLSLLKDKVGSVRLAVAESLDNIGYDRHYVSRQPVKPPVLPNYPPQIAPPRIPLNEFARLVLTPELQEALNDKNELVAGQILEILEFIAPVSKEAVSALVSAIKNEKYSVRYGAIYKVRWIQPPAIEAIPTLIKYLKDTDKSIRRESMFTLASLGCKDKELASLLVAALDDKYHLSSVCIALSQIGLEGKAAIPGLIQRLHYYWHSYEISSALASMAPDSIPPLIKSLKHKNTKTRVGAAKALGEIGASAKLAIPALREAIKDSDSDVRDSAKEALNQIIEAP